MNYFLLKGTLVSMCFNDFWKAYECLMVQEQPAVLLWSNSWHKPPQSSLRLRRPHIGLCYDSTDNDRCPSDSLRLKASRSRPSRHFLMLAITHGADALAEAFLMQAWGGYFWFWPPYERDGKTNNLRRHIYGVAVVTGEQCIQADWSWRCQHSTEWDPARDSVTPISQPPAEEANSQGDNILPSGRTIT